MDKINRYVQAATRDNTRRSYQSAITHFEIKWGGFLPATADSVTRYLIDHADTLTLNTLKQRLAALAQWHLEQGFPDPTKAPLVKKVLKGINELHPHQEKRAKPLQLEQLQQLISYLELQIQQAMTANNTSQLFKHTRNRALALIGFWRGFRGDELSRLRVEHIELFPGEGMQIYLPRTKTNHTQQGRIYKAPALTRLCPVAAYQDWVNAALLTEGPVFRRIDRWGNIANEALNPNSLIPLLRHLFQAAKLPEAEQYSSHSLRRGFASWANANQWDIKSLMEYVGWKDIKSAMRYIDAADSYGQQRIEAALATLPILDGENNATREKYAT